MRELVYLAIEAVIEGCTCNYFHTCQKEISRWPPETRETLSNDHLKPKLDKLRLVLYMDYITLSPETVCSLLVSYRVIQKHRATIGLMDQIHKRKHEGNAARCLQRILYICTALHWIALMVRAINKNFWKWWKTLHGRVRSTWWTVPRGKDLQGYNRRMQPRKSSKDQYVRPARSHRGDQTAS